MGVLAAAAINAARDFHPAFDRQSTPDIVALRQAARYQQGLLAAIAETKLDRVHVKQVIPLPLTRFDQGVELNPYIRIHGATAYTVDSPAIAVNVELIEYPERLDVNVPGLRMPDRIWPPTWLGKPSGYVEAGFLKLLGAATDWQNVARVEVDLFPVGPDELKLTDQLMLPGQPLRACVADLAAFMGLRAGVAMPDPTGARESYLDEVTERRRAKVGQIREVWVLAGLAVSLAAASIVPRPVSAMTSPSHFVHANPTTARAGRVNNVVRMPFRAYSLSGIQRGGAVAAQRVVATGRDFQVPRVEATRIPAQMVQCHSGWNRTDEQFVGPPMDQEPLSVFTGVEIPLSTTGSAGPKPAHGRVGAIGQSFDERPRTQSLHCRNTNPTKRRREY